MEQNWEGEWLHAIGIKQAEVLKGASCIPQKKNPKGSFPTFLLFSITYSRKKMGSDTLLHVMPFSLWKRGMWVLFSWMLRKPSGDPSKTASRPCLLDQSSSW